MAIWIDHHPMKTMITFFFQKKISIWILHCDVKDIHAMQILRLMPPCPRILNGKSNSLFPCSSIYKPSHLWKLCNTNYVLVSTCQKAVNNKCCPVQTITIAIDLNINSCGSFYKSYCSKILRPIMREVYRSPESIISQQCPDYIIGTPQTWKQAHSVLSTAISLSLTSVDCFVFCSWLFHKY